MEAKSPSGEAAIAPLLRQDAKELVLRVLSENPGLAAKAIHQHLVQEHSQSITYQGVHKAVKQLLEQGVLQKGVGGYSIRPEWVQGLRAFAEYAEKARSESFTGSLLNVPPGGSASITFETPLAVGLFVLDQVHRLSRRGPLLASKEWFHTWPATVTVESVYQKIREASRQARINATVRGDTPMDRFFGNFLESLGEHVVTGVDCAREFDLAAVGDYLLQIHWPEAYRKSMHKAYVSAGERPGEALQNVYRVVFDEFSHTRIPVLIAHDRELAQRVHDRVSKHFPQKGKPEAKA